MRTKVLFILVFLSSVVFAQYESVNYDLEKPGFEYDLLGKGARAAGMGYAFTSIADDVTAIHWNPAGTALIKRPEFCMSGKGLKLNMLHSDYQNMEAGFIYLPDFAGIVYPFELFGRTFTGGFSYQNQINYESHYKGWNVNGDRQKLFRAKYLINTFSLSAAYAFTPNLLIGTSLSYWFSMGDDTEGYYYERNKNLNYERYSVYTKKSSYSGLNPSLGVLIDLTSLNVPLHIGVKYTGGFKLKVDIESKEGIDTIFYTYQNIDDSDFSNIWEGTQTYNMPWMLSTGISYRFGDYYTLACDYDIKPFKGAEYLWEGYHFTNLVQPNIDTSFTEYRSMTESNENLNQFRIGMEYIWHPSKYLIPFRTGFKTNPTSFANYNDQSEIVGQGRAYSFNLGLGIIINRISIDLGYEIYFYNRQFQNKTAEFRFYQFTSISTIITL